MHYHGIVTFRIRQLTRHVVRMEETRQIYINVFRESLVGSLFKLEQRSKRSYILTWDSVALSFEDETEARHTNLSGSIHFPFFVTLTLGNFLTLYIILKRIMWYRLQYIIIITFLSTFKVHQIY
jgi:hypothetical protein